MTEPEPPREGERIAKLLARAGVASRREVERMIADGRVKLNGELLTTPATVLKTLRGVTVDDKPVKAAEPTRIFIFHKPAGLLTAEREFSGRPTIYTALRNAMPEDAGRVMPVGRLDFNTEGLLILTNDGELKRAMELPSTGLPRTYRARTFGDISQAQLEELIEGVEIDGVRYGKIDANLERSTGRNQWIEVTITEGKNREVRRVLEHLGLEVSRLLRTRYGPFELFDLPRGQVVEIRQAEVERFRRALVGGTGTEITMNAPQQARARIARTSPRKPDAPRKAEPAAPFARKPAPRKSDGARKPDGPRKPDGARKFEGARKPDGARKFEGSRKPASAASASRKPAPRKPGPRKPGPRK
jgi:23S rRNA pseudouridine2605 synthase